jgi:SAM-dependent methyltransferase
MNDCDGCADARKLAFGTRSRRPDVSYRLRTPPEPDSERPARVMTTGPPCPSCHASATIDRGPLPAFGTDTFGGQPIATRLAPGQLHECATCGLLFRSPYLDQQTLTSMYRDLPVTVWAATEPRPYWPRVAELMEANSPSASVLDVGCFSGDFLAWLPERWHKFGVEPAAAAREMAQRRGVTCLGETLAAVAPSQRFGCVTMFDIIEHVVDPLTLVAQARSHLDPGGCLIVLTGAADSMAWRLFGRRYWYSSLPEHVSFFRRRWFADTSARLGLTLRHYELLSSESSQPRKSLKEFGQLSLYSTVCVLRERHVSERLMRVVPFVARATRWRGVPWWKQARDHALVVMTRDEEADCTLRGLCP